MKSQVDVGVLVGKLSSAQRERLEYIDFCLHFLGEVKRGDLVAHFGIGTAAATRDISQYKELAPRNLDFQQATKAYAATREFKALFKPVLQKVFAALSRGFSGSISQLEEPLISCEYPPELSPCVTEALSAVSRAIHMCKPVRLKYYSITSGDTEREIVPHTLVDNGSRWHVRAFDRRSQSFRDFVLTRVDSPVIDFDGVVSKHEVIARDDEFNRIVELSLVPHPGYERPEIVKRDFRMIDGRLKIKVRASQAGYLLRRWSVDCSPDHTLTGLEYQLWLEDSLALYGINNLKIAPGYESPRKCSEQIP